jgi:hypothetical protein
MEAERADLELPSAEMEGQMVAVAGRMADAVSRQQEWVSMQQMKQLVRAPAAACPRAAPRASAGAPAAAAAALAADARLARDAAPSPRGPGAHLLPRGHGRRALAARGLPA